MFEPFATGDLWLNIDGHTFAVIDSCGDGWVSYFANMDKREVLTFEDFLLLFYPLNPEKALAQL